MNWQIHPTSRKALPEPVCNAGLLRIEHPKHGPLLFFSNPDATRGRHHFTLKVSKDEGMTWPKKWHTLYDERPGSGYSVLTPIGRDQIGVLYEGPGELFFLRFSIDELMARLRAMHRRAETFSGPIGGSDANEILQVADLSMNTRTRDVNRGERSIRLSVKEYELLNFLMRGAGRVLERQEIMHGVWGENFYGDDNLLDVYIRYLRQKVEQDDAPTLIHTIRGVGFILREQSS